MDNLFEKYLTEEEKKAIVEEEFRAAFARYMKDETSFKRIITNACYGTVWKMVDEAFDLNLEKIMKKRVEEIIGNMTYFTVFKAPDAWERESNGAYKLLQQCLQESKPLLKDKVVAAIQSAPKGYIRAVGQEAFNNIVRDAIKGGKQ